MALFAEGATDARLENHQHVEWRTEEGRDKPLCWHTIREITVAVRARQGVSVKSLQERIEELPPELQREVEDFVEFLHERSSTKHRGRPMFEWAGAMADLKDRYTSVELQHEIAAWRRGQ
jgi:hypothetical protein